jgi:hypothetical protein
VFVELDGGHDDADDQDNLETVWGGRLADKLAVATINRALRWFSN